MLKRTAFLFLRSFLDNVCSVTGNPGQGHCIASKVSTQVNKNIFQTLQTTLSNFINNRKWTTDAFQTNEKIQCNFLLNIEQELGNNLYKGKLTVQAARPVFSTTYDSPIINFLDDDVVFRYQEFQPVEFNENRVQGNDPSAANLPAVMAYYVNIILGFDYGSFSLRGGDPYFKKAWNIVNNARKAATLRVGNLLKIFVTVIGWPKI